MTEPDGIALKGREMTKLVRKTVVDMLKWSSIAVAEERLTNDSDNEYSDEDKAQ
ncbi:MAG: hypothetical protein QF415_14565 [Candidatus Undinarchaeales archaeon]|jgi:hypothetical protein|nr:hypothetical protein [Candidatus Undinarchaeales archaeon]MDP7494291.1 hypothetical protein [Candidatus Undinarchaeales archaeon]